MKIGKLQESILDRSVFKQIHKRNDNILCKPQDICTSLYLRMNRPVFGINRIETFYKNFDNKQEVS